MEKTETEYVMYTIFLIGILAAIYYMANVLASGVTTAVILEKTILTGIIIAILLVLAIVLFKQVEMRESIRQIGQGRASEKKYTRTAKDVRRDMLRIYRDMGALKIVFQDGIIDKKTHDRERKELDDRIKPLKKEYEKLKKK